MMVDYDKCNSKSKNDVGVLNKLDHKNVRNFFLKLRLGNSYG